MFKESSRVVPSQGTPEISGVVDEPPPIASCPEGDPPSPDQEPSPFASRSSLPVSQRSLRFLKSHFPEATIADWSNWHWQIRNSISNRSQLEDILHLTEAEIQALSDGSHGLPLRITPYYASLLSSTDAAHALRRTVVPVVDELTSGPGEARDPLGEDGQSPVEGLIHRYPDRALFLVTGFCSTYCRFCTRSRMVGCSRRFRGSITQWQQAIAYIEQTPAIRDVLISGGDPLTLPDSQLDFILAGIMRIPHVEMVRIGTKVPVVLPQRITPRLLRVLKKYRPLWLSLHFTHPEELTAETSAACNLLADAGIPLGSQTVLLKGINDSVETLTALMRGLLRMRVRPYYLYQCDPILGSAHFRTPVSRGLEMIEGLRGHTSGYAVPQFVIDAPGGGGKIPLLPDYYQGRRESDVLLRNYQGRIFTYPDTATETPTGVQA